MLRRIFVELKTEVVARRQGNCFMTVFSLYPSINVMFNSSGGG
jgi:hypothetical protein